MCLAVRDQHNDIREWVEHHARLGVHKFYIWDMDSQPPMYDMVEDYVKAGLVEYWLMRERVSQPSAYNSCLSHFGRFHR